jgi:hypothetical protein
MAVALRSTEQQPGSGTNRNNFHHGEKLFVLTALGGNVEKWVSDAGAGPY